MHFPASLILLLLPAAPLAFAQEAAPEKLPDVTVQGRADSLVGVADTASQGFVGRDHLDNRPLLQPGELLETVPGLVITQHSGSGKANQYYLRGFNLDHGTDFATSVDGVPVNQPSHGHGQGYSDLNFVIPELVDGVAYRKGPYFADAGDFASAGAADLRYADRLKQGMAKVEGGSWGYFRQLVAHSQSLGGAHGETLTVAAEHVHADGPWDVKEDFEKWNGLVRFVRGTADQGLSVTGMAYDGKWTATDQIPQRALDTGLIGRYGSLNPTDNGRSSRFALSAEAHEKTAGGEAQVTAYVIRQDLRLASDFTFFMDDPVNGDQFVQKDERWTFGAKASQSWFGNLGSVRSETLLGGEFRGDRIQNGLYHATRDAVDATTRADRIWQTSGGLFVQNTLFWNDWLRTSAGLRGDLYRFDVKSDNSVNSGTETAGMASPKLGLVIGPFAKTEFYANAGGGFHSNDARGVTARVDPGSGTPLPGADPLVRTWGGEIGVRTAAVEGLQSSVALWALKNDSELLFIGDAGNTEPSRPTRRVGVEFANYYAVNQWLTLDADLSLSKARFTDSDPAGDRVPGSVQTVATGGVVVHDVAGFSAGLHARYFGPRDLIEDGSVQSQGALTLNLEASYKINAHWQITGAVFNLLNRKNQDVAYYYESQLPGEVAPVADVHFHPAEPMSVRLGMTATW